MRIGELAAIVGVSTRTVRHCHRIGLLPEPERQPNGYREYGLRDAVELARVRSDRAVLRRLRFRVRRQRQVSGPGLRRPAEPPARGVAKAVAVP